MGDLCGVWAEHDRRIREALERLSHEVSSDVRREVEYLLTHREYGVAVEGLLSHVQENCIAVDPSTCALLSELATDMADDD